MSKVFTVKTHKDDPIDNATLLGAQKMVTTLTNFLAAPSLISPLVIAINGEWGAGKTSIIDTVKKELERKKIVTAKFDAWQFEYSDVTSALIYEIVRQTRPMDKQLRQKAKELSMLALDIFSRKTVGMTLEEIKQHFDVSISAVTTLSAKLQEFMKDEIRDGRMVVFIDDLDRCSLENIIVILEAIKLYLTVPKLVFVLAIDISKVKLAWSIKYGKSEQLTEEGLKYLEKIIQIQLELPKPTPEEIREYLKSLDSEYTDDFTTLISVLNLRNPRSIKRLLNLISFRSNIPDTNDRKTEAAIVWSTLEAMVCEDIAANIYKSYGKAELVIQAINHLGGMESKAAEREFSNSETFAMIRNALGKKTHLSKDLITYAKAVRPFSGIGGNLYQAMDEIVAFSRKV